MPKIMGLIDWVILGVYVSTLMGLALYFSKSIKRQVDMFLAGRSMKGWPIALSMYMALFSTISFLGVVGWVNQTNGTIWIGLQNLGMMMMVPFVIWLYPVLFYKLKITTAYEYLERRFSRRVRLIGSAFFLASRMMWLSTILYSGSLVVCVMGGLTPEHGIQNGQVWSIIFLGLIASFLAIAGGIKGVIWTDVIQFFVLMGCVVLMSAIAIYRIGGIERVLQIAAKSGKFTPPQILSLTDNISIGSGLLLGMVSMLSSTGSDQVLLQTYLTAKNADVAKRSLKLSGFLVKPFSLIFPCLGVIIFSFFQLHPSVAATMHVPDEALPVFILNVMPTGVIGLAVAAILSALFSSVSSGLTAMSAVIHVDFMRKTTGLSQAKSVKLSRAIIFISGITIIACALLIRLLGAKNNIVQILNIVMYPFAGVLLGIFLLGLLTTRANAIGTLIGATAGFFITVCVALSKFFVIHFPALSTTNSDFSSAIIYMSKISNFYYGALSLALTVGCGYASSFLYKPKPRASLLGLVKGLEGKNEQTQRNVLKSIQ
jgi:SSS family transporter